VAGVQCSACLLVWRQGSGVAEVAQAESVGAEVFALLGLDGEGVGAGIEGKEGVAVADAGGEQ